MTLNLPLLYFVWTEKYCPNKNKSPNSWHVTSILVCCIFGYYLSRFSVDAMKQKHRTYHNGKNVKYYPELVNIFFLLKCVLCWQISFHFVGTNRWPWNSSRMIQIRVRIQQKKATVLSEQRCEQRRCIHPSQWLV